jgi:23S rRNA G2069 N7-methylase RlmK/C1962 C5-methylase RlmI
VKLSGIDAAPPIEGCETMGDLRAEMLINRVRKNRRMLKSWLRRESVSCYRLYDKDIPELPMAIDWYEGALHAAVFQRKRELEPAEAEGLLVELGAALGVAEQDCFLKSRARQKGETQYQALDAGGAKRIVSEAGLKFEVNLSDYLDTGLFLDHRPARQWVGAQAAGKKLLNLFAYTGAFTVHAAAGGAAETMSVDLSKTYLDWATRNLEHNGMRAGLRHQMLKTDVLDYLPHAPGNYFDMVVLDPPTFSNSKSMEGTLDVQRDHRAMLSGAWRCLKPGGMVYFSTNNRRFNLGDGLESSWRIEECSERSIPDDFRDRRAHQLWRLEKL